MLHLLHKTDQDPLHIYWILPSLLAPRMLGLVDRDNRSATYGCCDRAHWRYKFMDFPNARYQEIGLVLALLSQVNEEDNRFTKKFTGPVVESIIAFWLRTRHSDGSVDEAYPFERSFCATAFSTWSLLRSAQLAGLSLDPEIWYPTGKWLAAHQSLHNPNQNMASALSLLLLAEVCKCSEWQDIAQERVLSLSGQLGKYSCFQEYNGEDMGYHSITAALLGQFMEHVSDEPVNKLFYSSLDAFEQNIDPLGRIVRKEWSRSTQFVYIYALARAGKWDILRLMAQNIIKGNAFNPLWQDDRYMVPLCSDYLMAFLQWRQAGSPA